MFDSENYGVDGFIKYLPSFCDKTSIYLASFLQVDQ